jgi:FixJ family two-component response regulator
MATSLGEVSTEQFRGIVAVVDDDFQIRSAMRDLLWAFDYDCELYVSAEHFMSLAAGSKAICLLVDIQMGGMSGIDLKRRLNGSGFSMPTIFMTGSDCEIIRKEALEAGCVAFLRKPFQASALMDAIAKARSWRIDRSRTAGSGGASWFLLQAHAGLARACVGEPC